MGLHCSVVEWQDLRVVHEHLGVAYRDQEKLLAEAVAVHSLVNCQTRLEEGCSSEM